MDLAIAAADFNEKALKVWQALGPKIAASFANAKEAMAPHMESAQTVAEEVWRDMEENYPGASIVLVGFVLAFLSLAWERSACRRPAFRCCARKARLPAASAPVVPCEEETVSCEAFPARPTIIHVASPQRRRSEMHRVLPSEPSGSGLVNAALSSSRLSAPSEMRRRSSTPRGLPPQASERFVGAAQNLEVSNPDGVLDVFNNKPHEELYDVKNIGPVSVNKILIQRRRGGFANFDQVVECLGKIHAQKIVTSIDIYLEG